MEGYLGLFASAFLAATLVPFSSEALLAAMVSSARFEPMMLLVVAGGGNTLGSVANWLLGRFCLHWQDRKWFPFKPDQLARASKWFTRYGAWSLLLAWLPIIGDPLTFAAGVFRVNFWLFVILVALGKFGRYALLVFGVVGAIG